MAQASGKIKIYIFSSLVLSLICALLFTAAYLISFEPYIGYFKTSAFLPVLATTITLVTLVWFFSSLILIPKSAVKADAPQYGKSSKLTAGICSAGFAVYTLYRLFMLNVVATVPLLLTQACILLGALSTLFFLFIMLNKGTGISCKIYAGFAPIFWAAVSMTEAYVNKNIAMNNPFKITQMMAMMSFMLFMVYELRFLLGRGMPRLFMIFTLVGTLVSSVFIIPFLVVTIAGTYTLPDLLAAGCMNLLLTGYMVSRLFDFTTINSNPSV